MKTNNTIINILSVLVLLVILILACSEDMGGSSYSDASVDNSGAGKGGSMARFTIKGNYLYVVDNMSLKSFDISESTSIIYTDSTNIGWDIETIFPFSDYLFIGSRNGMYIYNINTPGHPELESLSQHFYSCDPVVSDGTYAFVTLNSASLGCGSRGNELQIYKITDVKYPDYIDNKELENPKGLAVDDNYLYVCDNGLKIFDRSSIYSLTPIVELNDVSNAYDVIVNNNIIILISPEGLYQYSFNGSIASLLSSIKVNSTL